MAAQDLCRRLAAHNLTAPSDGHDSRCPIHCRSEVVAVAFVSLAGVQANADTNDDRLGPGLGCERLLRGYCGSERVRGAREACAERVPSRREHVAASSRYRREHDLIVT